jgi:hypothetical protein
LAVVHDEFLVSVFDTENGMMLYEESFLGKGEVLDVAFTATSLIVALDDGDVHVLALSCLRASFPYPTHILKGDGNALRAVRALADGTALATLSYFSRLCIWDVHAEAIRHSVSIPGSFLNCIAVGGDIVVAGATDGSVRMRDLHCGALCGWWSGQVDDAVLGVAVTGNGMLVAVVTSQDAYLLDRGARAQWCRRASVLPCVPDAFRVQLSADGKTIMSIHANGVRVGNPNNLASWTDTCIGSPLNAALSGNGGMLTIVHEDSVEILRVS